MQVMCPEAISVPGRPGWLVILVCLLRASVAVHMCVCGVGGGLEGGGREVK